MVEILGSRRTLLLGLNELIVKQWDGNTWHVVVSVSVIS